MNPDSQEALNFIHQLVKKYALSDQERRSVDIHSTSRGGQGSRGYGRSEQGVEIGWWVHPERYQKEFAWLLRELQLNGNESVLSLACGPAFHEITLAHHFPNLKITATDLDPKEIDSARSIAREWGITTIDFRALPAEKLAQVARPKSVDAVMSLAALHDVVDLEMTFQRIAQILKPKGRFMFTYNPGRRTAQFPRKPPLETILGRYLKLIDGGPLITPEDSLCYYGDTELKSRKERGYGLVQEWRVAVARA